MGRKWLLLTFCLSSLFLFSSCKDYLFNSEINNSEQKGEDNSEKVINHSYTEVENLHIFYSEIFKQQQVTYFVYFYSLTCSHCASIKNEIIEFALSKKETIFFIKSSPEITIDENKAKEINVSNISDLAIRGYPSLIKIDESTLTLNVAGIAPIKLALNIN